MANNDNSERLYWCGVAILLVVATYLNHFHNSFHFDDSHTIESNYWIRSLSNIPLFFTDARTFSTIPANMTYRPLISTVLAFDYWLGRLNPLWYHVTIFTAYLLLLVCIFSLFRRLLGAEHEALAGFATIVFGVHPVCAETVNYVIQSADLYVALAMAASLLLFMQPAPWKHCHVVPLLLGGLCKPTILIFPLVLAAYMWLYSEKFRWQELVPSVICVAALGLLHHVMTPKTYTFGSMNPHAYFLTQPFVAAYFVRCFFWPTTLSADGDWDAITTLSDPRFFIGCGTVVALLVLATVSGRRRPAIAFGVAWFLLTFLPTALAPLAEVENDHRMFGPMIGLTLAVAGLLGTLPPLLLRRLAYTMPLIVLLLGWGTVQRNRVWHTEESLWQDVTIKSPRNGRGWMNYGLTQMGVGRYEVALDCYEHGLKYTPNYPLLFINMAIDQAAMHRDKEAEDNFHKAIGLDISSGRGHYYYARWLDGVGRFQEASEHIQLAEKAEPTNLQFTDLQKQIEGHLSGHPTASADAYMNVSLSAYQAGRYQDCIDNARKALELQPDYAAAYNNIAAGNMALQRWDEAIAAAQQALAIKPDFQLARNNLAAAQAGKQKAAPAPKQQLR